MGFNKPSVSPRRRWPNWVHVCCPAALHMLSSSAHPRRGWCHLQRAGRSSPRSPGPPSPSKRKLRSDVWSGNRGKRRFCDVGDDFYEPILGALRSPSQHDCLFFTLFPMPQWLIWSQIRVGFVLFIHLFLLSSPLRARELTAARLWSAGLNSPAKWTAGRWPRRSSSRALPLHVHLFSLRGSVVAQPHSGRLVIESGVQVVISANNHGLKRV